MSERKYWLQISVTKKLRPHWSDTEFDFSNIDMENFRNEKVTAPLKWAKVGAEFDIRHQFP